MPRNRDPFLMDDSDMYNRLPKSPEEIMAERMEQIRQEVRAAKGIGPVADGDAYASNLKPTKSVNEPKLGNLESPTSTPEQAPISPAALNVLAQKNPDLVARYKERMGLADEKVKDAQNMKDMAGYAGVAGRFLEDMSNSRKEDVILHNRMSDLGKAPGIRQQERYKYDQSGLDGMVADQDKVARSERDREEGQFFTEHKLKGMQEADTLKAAMKDPNSQESISARENLKMLMPDIEKKIPGFANLSAEQAERAAPTIMAKWKEDNAERRHRQSLEAKRSDRMAQEDFNRSEKLQKLQTPYGVANSEDDAKKLKEAHEAKSNFDSKIEEMIKLREEYGVEYLDREAVARGKQLSKDLLLEYKNMAKLGVLSKSDEDIINAIIPADPLGQDFAPGQDPILHKLKKFKQDSDRDFETRVKTRTRQGMKDYNSGETKSGSGEFPRQVRKDGKVATVNNQAELEEALEEGFK